MCARETEFKAILFSLCYFHAVVCERRKFGAQGWNRVYPYNTGDLTISVNVLYNYLEANPKVPWEDLRYLFGEIMYGGHITDDWDRKLCKTYLEVYMHPDMVRENLLSCNTAKQTRWPVRTAKTQISLGICPVWSESSLCAQWVAKNPRFLPADSKDWSDWADAQADPSLCRAQIILLVLLCGGLITMYTGCQMFIDLILLQFK